MKKNKEEIKTDWNGYALIQFNRKRFDHTRWYWVIQHSQTVWYPGSLESTKALANDVVTSPLRSACVDSVIRPRWACARLYLQERNYIYRVEQFLVCFITLSNINWFSNSFHCQEKICNNIITKNPTTPQVAVFKQEGLAVASIA